MLNLVFPYDGQEIRNITFGALLMKTNHLALEMEQFLSKEVAQEK